MMIEKEIIRIAQDEGIGSIYERIMLKRFFEKLIKNYKINTVLEYGCEITKGFDNFFFLKSDEISKVSVSDKNVGKIKKKWKFSKKPDFLFFDIKRKYDLVWNFALVQRNFFIINKMRELSNKYVLIFVPNFLNWGTAIHKLYHFLTRTECKHAERGRRYLMTKSGLEKIAKRSNLEILETGYIDIPPIPDIGFSINELKGNKKTKNRNVTLNDEEIKNFEYKIKKLSFLEKKYLPSLFKMFFAHHIYLFGQI